MSESTPDALEGSKDDFETRTLKSPKEFYDIWQTHAQTALWMITGVEMKLYREMSLAEFGEFNIPAWETLPTIHTCEGSQPDNLLAHLRCKTPRIFHPDQHKDFYSKIRHEVLKVVHPENLALIHGNILHRARTAQEHYADLTIVADDHWETLAKDRKIVSVIASNPFLPTDLAKVLVKAHKTPSIRIAIAHNTGDNGVLNDIWHGTRSEDIKAAVMENAAFVELHYFSNNKGLR